MSYKINGTVVVDNSRNVCACCVTACCVTATTRIDAPSGDTASRPASPATGSIYYDTDQGSLIAYTGTDWAAVGGAGGIEVENIVNNSCDAWTFMTILNADETHSQCRCYKGCCHGYIDYLNNNHSRLYAHECSITSGQNTFICSYNCAFQQAQFVPGRSSHCSFNLCACIHVLGCNQCLPVVFCVVACNCFNLRSPKFCSSPYDGSTVMRYYNQLCSPYAYLSCRCTYEIVEYFINTKGGITEQRQYSNSGCYSQIAAVYTFPVGAFPTPRYAAGTQYGWVAYTRYPIGCKDNANECLKCTSLYYVKPDTFGSGLEEVCNFANHMKNLCFIASAEYLALDDNFPVCFQYCYAMYTAENEASGMAYCTTHLCTDRKWAVETTSPFFISSAPDIIGKSVLNSDQYNDICVVYPDGTCFNGYQRDPACCYFGLVRVYGTDQCCLYPSGCITSSGMSFLSKDQCFIHNIYTCNMTNLYTAVCTCCIDQCVPFNTYRRLYSTKIDRLNQCIVEHVGFCCLEWGDWECDIFGCTSANPRFDRHFTGTCAMQSGQTFYLLGWTKVECNTANAVAARMCNVGANPTLSQAGVETSHWYAWSKVCPNKARFARCGECTCCLSVYTFDCNQDRVTEYLEINKFHGSCLARVLAKTFGKTPACLCVACDNFTCWLGGSTATPLDLINCIQTVTGHCCRSLMFHCLGYTWTPDNVNENCLLLVAPQKGMSCESHYFNTSNDHYVFIRALTCNSASTCSRCVLWLGAICYDLNNCCISKVNTLYPPPVEQRQYFCKVFYDCFCAGVGISQATGLYGFALNGCIGGAYSDVCGAMCCLGIRAFPYGGRKFYEDSGCTSYGGVVLVNSGFNALAQFCSSSTCCFTGCWDYFGANCTGNLFTGAIACFGVCVCGPGFTFSRVPYEQPLECVGWRSEPFLAQMLNAIVSPHYCSSFVFPALMTYGSTAHQCLAGCAYCNMLYTMPTTKTYTPTTCCCLCGPYGVYDCIEEVRTFKFYKSCCCVLSSCCFYNGCLPNGTYGAVTIECILTTLGNRCVPTMYKSIPASSIDTANSTKHIFKNHFENANTPLQAVPYYKSGRFEGQYFTLNTGEHPVERIHRWWNEDAICCC